jgi:hypothetical protein
VKAVFGKSVDADSRRVKLLFPLEATLLTHRGGLGGVNAGIGATRLIGTFAGGRCEAR